MMGKNITDYRPIFERFPNLALITLIQRLEGHGLLARKKFLRKDRGRPGFVQSDITNILLYRKLEKETLELVFGSQDKRAFGLG